MRPAVTLVAHEVGVRGGMEAQLAILAEGLLERGFAVTVVARRCVLDPHPSLRVVRVRGPRRPFSLGYPWFFLAGSIQVARRRRGLVHTTGAIVLNRADVSTIHFCHSAYRAVGGGSRSGADDLLHRVNVRIAQWQSLLAERFCFRPRITGRLVAVSEGVRRELDEHFPAMRGRTHAIPNGVDAERFAPDAERRARTRLALGHANGDRLALFVGGDWDRKGLQHAIRGLRGAPGWHLIVAGPGDADRFTELSRSAGVADRVTFLGPRDDTPDLYAAADAFVFPTAYEAFPLVALEAAAAGLPMLMTPVNGVDELLEDGVNGFEVTRDGDDVAAGLRRLDDPQARQALGASARASGTRYGWDAAVDAYADLYRTLFRVPGSG